MVDLADGALWTRERLVLWYIKATTEKRGAVWVKKGAWWMMGRCGAKKSGAEKQLDGFGGGAYAENSRVLNPLRG